ncbi:MAG: hypothetical protein ABS67_00880 [Niabella sp. SCN 42-15]|nr:MAG: hypothetical protein ABS67_00880 [Niabella sp. SCN 42-15]
MNSLITMNIFGVILLFIFGCDKTPKGADDNPASLKVYKDSVFTNYFKRTHGWVAGDGAISFSLNNGKSLWLYGDSYIDNYNLVTNTVPCLFQVRNAAVSMGISNPADQQTHLGSGSPKSTFQVGTDNKFWFWPGMGFAKGDTAYIFQNRLRNTGAGGAWAFESVDELHIAKMKISTMQVVGYSNLGTRNKISFNNGILKDGNYQYIYGIKNNGFGNDLMVARVPENNFYAPWEYYNGRSWNTDMTKASKIHAEFTSSFYVFKLKHKYVLLTTEFSVGCDQGKEIYSYTSDKPYGPFTNKKMIWTVDDTLNGHYPFFYIATAHPEYDNGKDEMLITYCINGYGDCVQTCNNNRMDPNVYRPRVIRVPYKIIDPAL